MLLCCYCVLDTLLYWTLNSNILPLAWYGSYSRGNNGWVELQRYPYTCLGV